MSDPLPTPAPIEMILLAEIDDTALPRDRTALEPAALRELRDRPGWEGWLRRLRLNGRLPATDELLRY